MSYIKWSRLDYKELIPNNFSVITDIFSSLKSRNFLLYFVGQCISLSGSWVQIIAMSWLVYRITGSVMLLATVTFLSQIPNLILTPFTGVLSDRFDRRKILIITQTLFMSQALVLATLTLFGMIQVWQIMVLSIFTGVVAAIEAPARQSFYTKLVPAKDMSNAVALNSVTINGSRFIGPTIGGFMISFFGEGYCFLINGVSYIATIVALMMMTLPRFVPYVRESNMISEIKQGFAYVNSNGPIKTVLVMVAVTSFFGLPFMTIIPAFVKDVLGGESLMLGYVMSSIGAGSMVAALYLAARKKIQGLGKIVTISGGLFGLGLIALSIVHVPAVAYIICFPIGFGVIALAATCNTLLQTMVEDHMRGRVMSLFTMAFMGMSPLGSMLTGWMAKTVGLNGIMLISGSICIISVIIYEYYRPYVRKMVHETHKKRGIIPEIATGININPF